MKKFLDRLPAGRCLAAMSRYITRRYPSMQMALPTARMGNRARLLVNGNEALPVMLDMIETARKSIRWQVMLFHPDEIGERLVLALAQAARRGVEVQLSFGIDQSMNGSPADRVPRVVQSANQHSMQRLLGVLRGAGVDVRENRAGAGSRLGAAGARAGSIQQSINRAVCIPANHYDHRKLLIVDDVTALVGGMNVGRHYLYDSAPELTLAMPAEARQRQLRGQPEAWDKWLDVSVVVQGPIVAEIGAAFDWKWAVLGGTPLSGSMLGGAPAASDWPGTGWFETVPAQFLEQRPGSPEVGARFFALVQAARQEVWVASPFVSYTPAMAALRAAARRGVRVTVVVPDAFQEMPVSARIFREFVPDLLADGVEVWFNDLRMAHTKLLVVDRQVLLLGSFNLNFRSFLHDLEVALVFEDERLAQEAMQRVFLPYLAISRQIETFRRPSFSLLNWLVRPFS